LVLGDFNADGHIDLATGNITANTISILFGDGDGTFQPHVDSPVGSGPISLTDGDFDGSGMLGILSANTNANSLSLLLQTTVTFSPATLNFGAITIGTASAPYTSTLTNIGSAPLNVTSVSVTGPDATNFSQTNTCGTVAPGGTCTMSVTFSPSAENTRTAAVSITDNALGSPQSVILTGQGTVVHLAPASLNFGSVQLGQVSPDQTVTLTNTGHSAITISKVTVGGPNPGDFRVENSRGSHVKPGTRCTFVVNFIPTKNSLRKAMVTVFDTGGGTSQDFILSGTGT